MCLMLYLGTSIELPLRRSSDLCVETIDPLRLTVRQWFSTPHVHFVGAHTGCSCGFPSVMAEEPLEYFDGLFSDAENRDADLRSVRALLVIVREQVAASGEVQLYPVWNGEEGEAPKGTITLKLAELDPTTFFFNERFFYRVTRESA